MPLNPATKMISSRWAPVWQMARRIFPQRRGIFPTQGLRALNRKADTDSSNQQENCTSREAAHRISAAELILFERSGHYPFMEEPQAFWSAVGIADTDPRDYVRAVRSARRSRIASDYNLLRGGLLPIGLLVLTATPLIATRIRSAS